MSDLQKFIDSVIERLEKLEKENLKLLCKISTLYGNMDAVMKILKDLMKKDWEK